MVFGLNSGLLQSQNSPITGVYTAFVAHSVRIPPFAVVGKSRAA